MVSQPCAWAMARTSSGANWRSVFMSRTPLSHACPAEAGSARGAVSVAAFPPKKRI